MEQTDAQRGGAGGRARGAGGARGGGVRNRGVGRGRGMVRPEPETNDNFLFDSTRGLHYGVPLEQPLWSIKRQRVLDPPSAVMLSTVADPQAGPSCTEKSLPPPARSPSPVSSPAPSISFADVDTGSSRSSPMLAGQQSLEDRIDSYSPLTIPPPAAFEDVQASGSTPIPIHRPLHDSDKRNVFCNYGSEEDTGPDYDLEYGLYPMITSRADRDAYEDEDNDDDDPMPSAAQSSDLEPKPASLSFGLPPPSSSSASPLLPHPLRPLQDSDMNVFCNYESEEDSDPDYDLEYGLYPMITSRADRDAYEDEDNDDEDDGPMPSAAQSSDLERKPVSPSFGLPPPSSSSASPLPHPLSPSSSQVGPRSLFDFEWRDFPESPVLPTERREVFSEINCGPTTTTPYPTPYDAFTAIWTPEFMGDIVLKTNSFAQQVADRQYQGGSLRSSNRITDWQDTNVNELYVFFGLLLGTGLCIKGDLEEYWSKEDAYATPNIASYMTFDRFNLLSRCLHFSDNRTDLQTMTRPQANVYKIAPVVQHLNRQFQSLYRLSRHIALDESLTLWKGLFDFEQFKAASARFKTYEVCESLTGYLWRVKVLAGREVPVSEVTPDSGMIETLVLDLIKGLENKGHTIWMDKYYSSPTLARVLKSLGFDCVGTLLTNRQCVPAQLANLKKADMQIGQIYGCTSGDVDLMVWRDRKRKGLISTYHGAAVHADADGSIEPIAIRKYNLCMGRVDKKNQILSLYSMERKHGQIWYKTFFKRILNASILNAFILYTHSSSNTEGRISRHRDFRNTLFHQILSKNFLSIARTPSAPPKLAKEMLEHFPAEYGYLTHRDGKNEKIRRSCVICARLSETYCPKCNVALCIGCCKEYHINRYNL